MRARLDEQNGGGYFLAAPHTIGATDEEIADFNTRSQFPTERQLAIHQNASAALQRLLAEPAQGHA